MTEGWQDDEYLILFDENEIKTMTEQYGLKHFINGFQIFGLCGWDDFILQDVAGKLFTMPTVPVAPERLKPFRHVIKHGKIKPDSRFSGTVKWYVQPLIFGGDPQAKENVTWINLQQHAEVVQWWNKKYREARGV